jgi:hypothetical protein
MTYRGITCLLQTACLVALGSFFTFASARADVAVMVPPRTDQAPPSDATEMATEELSRLLRLQGFDVISDGQAAAYADGQQRSGAFPKNYDPMFCITPECANEYRKLFDALFAVQLTIATKAGRPSSVSVILTENPQAFYSATATVEGGDVRAALRVAYEEARDKQRDGAGPWMSITGVPDGATVYLDNEEFGHVPFKRKRRVTPGPHRLETRAEDHITDVRTINVPGNIDHVENVVVALQPVVTEAVVGSGPQRRRIRRSVWDWVIGGTVAAVGAAHLIAGVYQKTKDGDCAERANGTCTEVYGTGSGVSRDNLMIGLGSAGVAVGGLVMGLGPFGALGVKANAEHALLELKGQF